MPRLREGRVVIVLEWDSEDPEVVRVDGVSYLIREVDAVLARMNVRSLS